MGDVVVVTGGSRGIGRATARLLARRGYAVCLSFARSAEAAHAIVEEIRASGGAAEAVRGDVAVESDVIALFKVADGMGRLAGLVNNAGIVDRTARLDEMTVDRLNRMFAVNITGSFLAAREAVRRMSTRNGGKGGAIVNVSSAASRLGGAGMYVDYAASKGAIDTFTIGLAREVAAEGIRVNAVSPGIIDTEIHASAGNPDRVERIRDMLPMKREGKAEEVAEAIVWLISDAASYVTGANLDVTGGR